MDPSSETASAKAKNGATTTAASPSTPSPVDEKEEFLTRLCGALVLLREAAECRDLRFVLRMLRRLSVLRRQQQRCLPQLLQTAEALLWGPKAAGSAILEPRNSNPSRRAAAANLAAAAALPPGTAAFWKTMRETLEAEIQRRSREERAMEVDGVKRRLCVSV